MIGKEDIRDRAGEWQLRMDVVEKDYVLGWLLVALGQHPEAATRWVFKGGTCLKKCFFETYRFSEDLDFSLLPEAVYTEEELRRILLEVSKTAAELSGVAFPADALSVHVRRNLQGEPTFEARVGYRGPLDVPTAPRVRIDLTGHEPVLEGVVRRPIFHPYPDTLPAESSIAAYALDELFAEKTRALIERTRPRDLYDVVFILENRGDAIDFDHARELLRKKCGVKHLPVPSAEGLIERIRTSEELRTEWANMLGHQLPQLPPIDTYLERLPNLLRWIDRPVALPAVALVSAPARADEQLVVAPGLRYWGAGVPLEAIRFAGANRLLVEFSYHGGQRLVEPYSLRRSSTGKLLLYGWERDSNQIKAYHTAEMSNVRATSHTFTPRFAVELSATGPISAPPTRAPIRSSGWSPPRAVRPIRPRGVSRRGPTGRGIVHIYDCPICGKRFRRSTMDSTLRPHKDRHGYPCVGRSGIYVDTRYG